jgi:hypothetical protein
LIKRPTHAAKRTVQPLSMPSKACLFWTIYREIIAPKRRRDASMVEKIAIK